MIRPRALHAFALLSLVVSSAGCGDSSVAPLEAQEARESQEVELLLAVLDRLDEIEGRLERETALLDARLDSLAAAGAFAARMPDGAGAPPEDRGGNGFAAEFDLLGARTDSIMALVDFLAKGSASPWQGFTVCGGLGVKGAADLKSRTAATAEGEGGVGVKPWDTGALAQLTVAQWGMVELGAGAELKVDVNGCVDLSKIGAEVPSTRPAAVAPRFAGPAAASIPQLQSTLLSLGGRLGFEATEVDRALSLGVGIFESGDFGRLVDLPSTLPVPPAFSDPLGTVRQRMTSFDPVDLLCGAGTFGPRIGPFVSDGCQYIQANDLPELGTFLNLGRNFSGLQSRFGSLCSRFNNVVDRRLVISAGNTPWSGSALDVALFPDSWSVACGD